jgi:tetratricopeptide (TPR) repeat protein
LGNYQEAINLRTKAQTIYRELGNVENELFEIRSMAGAFLLLGQFDQAIRNAENALTGFIKMKKIDEIIECLSTLIYANLEIGKSYLAEVYVDNGLPILPYVKDDAKRSSFFLMGGLVRMKASDYESALKLFMYVLEESKDRNNVFDIGEAYGAIGWNYLAIGDYEKAQYYLEKSLENFSNSHYRYGEAMALNKLGLVLGSSRRYDEALTALEKAEKIFHDIGNTKGWIESMLIQSYIRSGELIERLGKGFQSDNAKLLINDLTKTYELSKNYGLKGSEAAALLMLGSIYYKIGKYDNAQKYLLDSLAITEENVLVELFIPVNYNLGLVSEKKNEYDAALNYYQEAIKFIERTQSVLSRGPLTGC